MTIPFTYSVLQYKHSLALGEAINVAILFQFPAAEKLQFVAGNAYRVKAIYPDFDQTVYNYLIKGIEAKLKDESNSLFRQFNLNGDFKKFLNGAILPEDATALQFQEPVNVIGWDRDTDIGKIVEEFSKLLLPGIITKKAEAIKHNEHFLIRKFTGYIFEKHKQLESKFTKNQIIKTKVQNKTIELKFELAWGKTHTNLIKPLSFDLSEEKSIQDKSAINYGYLNLLGDYARQHNYRFDLIVAKPQNKDLYKSYENALGLLELSSAPKRIVTEKELSNYSEETIEELLQN
jgi:Protein of unknown function (DUF3037)